VLHPSVEEVVADLHDVDAADAHAGLDLCHREVRHADEPNLPRANDVVQRAEGVLERRVEVRPVDQVDVDHVGLEPAEGEVDLPLQAPGRRVAADSRVARLPGEAALRHEDHALTAAPERLAHHLLGMAEPVRRGGVHAVDAAVEGPVDRLDGLLVLDRAVAIPAAHGPTPEAESRDVEARPSERAMLHRRLPRPIRPTRGDPRRTAGRAA
jgi:hypothetical protein